MMATRLATPTFPSRGWSSGRTRAAAAEQLVERTAGRFVPLAALHAR